MLDKEKWVVLEVMGLPLVAKVKDVKRKYWISPPIDTREQAEKFKKLFY